MTINIEFRGCRVTPTNRIRLQFEICYAIKKSPERINLLFATTGGEISEGLLFYEFARGLDYPINIYNIGEVSSAGTVMFLAFDNRYFLPKAKFLFHSVRISEGTEKTSERELHTKKFNEQMLSIFKERIKLPDQHFTTMNQSEEDINIDNSDDIKKFLIANSSEEKFSEPFIKIPC